MTCHDRGGKVFNEPIALPKHAIDTPNQTPLRLPRSVKAEVAKVAESVLISSWLSRPARSWRLLRRHCLR
jgi:hypothetical protein